jgi:putative transposase
VEVEVMPDHVHLLVEADPQFGIHRLVNAIKGRSSRVLRQEFPSLRSKLPTLWTNSSLVATVPSWPPWAGHPPMSSSGISRTGRSGEASC